MARQGRIQARDTSDIRAYVFARERDLCRCCRCRPAESMHEMRFRSLGGKVGRKNSIAVCGDGVRGCHGLLQRHEIDWSAVTASGAEGTLLFTAMTGPAADHLKVAIGEVIESKVFVEIEAEL